MEACTRLESGESASGSGEAAGWVGSGRLREVVAFGTTGAEQEGGRKEHLRRRQGILDRSRLRSEKAEPAGTNRGRQQAGSVSCLPSFLSCLLTPPPEGTQVSLGYSGGSSQSRDVGGVAFHPDPLISQCPLRKFSIGYPFLPRAVRGLKLF